MKTGGARGGPRAAVLIALCAAGLMLFNFPLLVVWESEAEIFGLPLLPMALFLIWAGLIGVLAWVVERRRGDD